MADPYTNRVVRHLLTGTALIVAWASPRGPSAWLLHVQLPSGLPTEWRSEEVEILDPATARARLFGIDGGAMTRVPARLPALRPEHPVGGGSAA